MEANSTRGCASASLTHTGLSVSDRECTALTEHHKLISVRYYMGWARTALYHSIRLLGGFALAQRLTGKKLRILCYHGFSITDEHILSPYVFMRIATFERRMQILKNRRIPVKSLDEGIESLVRGTVKRGETVITFDDGWESNLTVVPILKAHGYPASIYVTTEHLDADAQAFNVTLGHLLHQSTRREVALQNIHPEIDGNYRVADDARATTAQLIKAAARISTLAERQRLLPAIAESLGINYEEFVRGGRFRFLDREGIREASRLGMDIQLHTHTHNLPADTFEASSQEIRKNKLAITAITDIEPVHFCYPSGIYFPQHQDWLARLGIKSATTCDSGLNDATVPLLLLKRYLDSEDTSDIEFEAEIAGVRDVFRNVRSTIKSVLRI